MGWCDFWEENSWPGMGTPPACKAKDVAEDEVREAAADAWEEIVHSFQEGAVWMVKEVSVGWLGADSPALSQQTGTVAFLFGSTLAITQWLAVLSLLIAAGQMAWTRRAEPAKVAAAGIIRLIVATSAAVAVVNLLTKAGDMFSVWLITRSLGCGDSTASKACVKSFSEKLLEMTALNNVDQLAVSFIIALLLIVSGFIQLVSVIFRQSMLFVLVGTLPLAAAVSSTEYGKGWWRKSLGWLLAFVCYKPAAAIIYAAAFSQFSATDSDDKSLMPQLYGVCLLILAAFTLPALMRLVVPLTEEGGLGGGGGGGGGMASRIATGAIALKTGGASMAAASMAKGAKGGGGGPTGGATAGGGGAPSSGSGGKPSGGGTPSAGSGGSSSSAATGAGAPASGGSGGQPSAPSSGSSNTSNPPPPRSGSSGSGSGASGGRVPSPSTPPSTGSTRPQQPKNGGPRGSQ